MTLPVIDKNNSPATSNEFKALTKKVFQNVAKVIIILLTALPIIRLVIFLSTTGANNLSNDHVGSFPVIDQVLNSTYDWRHFFKDTFSQGHSSALTVLAQLILAKISDLNVYVVIYLGILFSGIKLILLHNSFTYFTKSNSNWALWPILSALVYSTSQISTYEYDFATLEMGLFQLGVVVGIWALVRFTDRWVAVMLMIAGGFVANWTWAGGPLLWPVFFIGMVWLKIRKITQYLVVLCAALISSWPYFHFLILYPGRGQFHENETVVSLFNYTIIIQSIGLPFAQDLSSSMANSRGWVGLILCLIGMFTLWIGRKKITVIQFTPGILLIFYSLLNIWQISIFRQGLAPWYASPFMLFWIGLVGVGYGLWVVGYNAASKTSSIYNILHLINQGFFLALIGILIYFYFTSNLSYSDKSFLLRTRSPASTSCLRNYRTAPTYCERTLFVWELGEFQLMSKLGQALERNNLSVFAPKQRWDLQGDFILGNVKTYQATESPDIFWSTDLSNQPTPWLDYRHLNLFLHSPNAIEWMVRLPSNLKQAEFNSAIAISKSAPQDPNADGVIFEVSVRPETGPSQTQFRQYLAYDQRKWQPLKIPLTQFAGQTITLRLASETRKNNLHDWAMFRFPYIHIVLSPTGNGHKNENIEIRPSNTDLSPWMPKPTAKDFSFDMTRPEIWEISSMTPVHAARIPDTTWEVGDDPFLRFKQPLNLCLSEFSHIYMRLSASPDIMRRYAQVFLQINNVNGYQKIPEITLLADGQMHEYTFDLKLLELEKGSRLTGIRLDPVERGETSNRSKVKITEFRLIRKDLPTPCGEIETALVQQQSSI